MKETAGLKKRMGYYAGIKKGVWTFNEYFAKRKDIKQNNANNISVFGKIDQINLQME